MFTNKTALRLCLVIGLIICNSAKITAKNTTNATIHDAPSLVPDEHRKITTGNYKQDSPFTLSRYTSGFSKLIDSKILLIIPDLQAMSCAFTHNWLIRHLYNSA